MTMKKKAITPEKNPLLVEINRRNKMFWEDKANEFIELCEKYPHDAREAATLVEKLMKAGHGNDQDFTKETSLESAMQNAKKLRAKDNAKRACQPRPDPLQLLIQKAVLENPSIRANGLLTWLKEQERGEVIDEITSDEIYWIVDNGRGGSSAPISGLKDRLSRAKKTLKVITDSGRSKSPTPIECEK